MIEILELVLLVIIIVAAIATWALPAIIAVLTGNDKWFWGLIITIPFGMAVFVYFMLCNEWIESLGPACQ